MSYLGRLRRDEDFLKALGVIEEEPELILREGGVGVFEVEVRAVIVHKADLEVGVGILQVVPFRHHQEVSGDGLNECGALGVGDNV